MQDTEIFVKTDAGRDEIRSRTLGLPMSVRAILLMIDGVRPVSAMRSLIAGSKAPADVLDSLVAQGLIERRGGTASTDATTPVAAPVAAAIVPVAAPPPPRAPVADVVGPREAAAPAAEPLLDLVLPTIHAAPPVDSQPVAVTPAPQNAYEHLYAMMNEIVRDFLAPHRRYFFQLKIERCGTAEELLDLLHGLHTALAKSRGEAFASEVIARLRSAMA